MKGSYLIIVLLFLVSCASTKKIKELKIDKPLYSIKYKSDWKKTKIKGYPEEASVVLLKLKKFSNNGIHKVSSSFSIIENFLTSKKELSDLLQQIVTKEQELMKFSKIEKIEIKLFKNYIETRGVNQKGTKFFSKYYKVDTKIIRVCFYAFSVEEFNKRKVDMHYFYSNLKIK